MDRLVNYASIYRIITGQWIGQGARTARARRKHPHAGSSAVKHVDATLARCSACIACGLVENRGSGPNIARRHSSSPRPVLLVLFFPRPPRLHLFLLVFLHLLKPPAPLRPSLLHRASLHPSPNRQARSQRCDPQRLFLLRTACCSSRAIAESVDSSSVYSPIDVVHTPSTTPHSS